MKNHFLILVFFFSFGFAQDKLTYQRFRVSRKSTTIEPKKPTAEDVAEFKSLDFFNQRKCCDYKFVRTEKPFEMKTSTSRKPIYIKYGNYFYNGW
jgi:hypothetical protein